MHSSASNPSRFLLVRHAQTSWNREHRHTGSVEVPLSPLAAGQIKRLTKRLENRPIDAIYSSPLSRCQATILPLAEALHEPIITEKDLVERNLGEWEGKSPAELLPLHPGYEFPQSAYTGQFHIPQAEPLEELEARLRFFLTTVHKHHPGQSIVLCTHSGVIWTILHRIVINPPEAFFWPSNCSITTIISEGNHFRFVEFEEGK